MLSWIEEKFTDYKPERSVAVRALRHMRTNDRKNLFSDDIMLMRSAEGYWFEYLIYEQLIRISEESDTIKKIVRKGADVRKKKERMRLGLNEIYSADKGDIKVRGNGQDLAEVDLLLFDNDNNAVFCEIVTSPSDLKDLEAEIIYKKKLFGYMFDQERVGFILFSAVDISNTQVVKRLVRDKDNLYITTCSCETMKACLKGLRITGFQRSPEKHPKLISANSLRIRPFDYKKMHDEALSRFYFAMRHGFTNEEFFSDPCISPIVKKIIIGGLYPSAVKSLISDYGLRIKSKDIPFDTFSDNYSRVILAVDFPEIEPIIYIKPRKEKTYYKLVKASFGGFRYERLTPSRVGFYLWLETVKPCIGSEGLHGILEYCANDLTAMPPLDVIPSPPQKPKKAKKKNNK